MSADTFQTCWLDLNRGAAGLQGPFLIERDVYHALHRMANRLVMLQGMAKVKGGPKSPNTTLHPLKADSLASPADIAGRLYPLVLAPMCAAVVFSEAEFGSLEAIIQLLASWVRHITAHGNRRLRFRPSIIIYRHKLARLPGDLENRITAEVLATCNYAREMTTKQAEATWRACFGSITAVLSTLEDEQGVCREALAVSNRTASCPPALPRLQLISVLRYACVHFSHNYIHPINIIQGSRMFKITDELPRQLEVIFEYTAETAMVNPLSYLVAAALGIDSFRAGVAAFEPEDIFEESYWPFLDRLKRLPTWHAFAAAVQQDFNHLVRETRGQEPADVLCRALAKVQKSLAATAPGSLLERLCREEVCLSCLAHNTHITLPCRHRLCDYSPQSARNLIPREYGFCASQAQRPTHRQLAGFYKLFVLRSDGYKFGRKLQFRHDEFRSNLVRMSMATDDSVAQAKLQWPGCKIDAIIEYSGGEFEEAQISLIGEKLQASLFYLEVAEALPSFSTPASVEILIRCRLPPGPELADLVRRLHSKNVQVGYYGDGPSRQAEFCTATIWDRIRRGHPFERRLHGHGNGERRA
ncbi:hypothetical protein J7T55_011992 [Diaporthe amygdali]|uniref:uncharacterized protein n=1 Tax=Phomopsis amygdali TaxID=1214568 RepID=UPI0022FDC8D2|nr:uncharacterized protein J7T55_011992 [Diaporthe amygdali]KAJ0123527.1 hypothetical protein J7T55_011992 [Diaporthe amygdali]